MQGQCASNSFEHPPNVETQKLHENLRRQWCLSHVETHMHYCNQSMGMRNWSTSLRQEKENLAKTHEGEYPKHHQVCKQSI